MKKKIVMLVLSCFLLIPFSMRAQVPVVDLVGELVAKVIIAIDLKVQRLQNETIWLQNAQKTVENSMSKLKLEEIRDWVEEHRKLYEDYFQELWKVKDAISTYYRVKEIIDKQLLVVKEYKSAWTLLQQDTNFTPDELKVIYATYSGMLQQSLKNLDGLFLVVNAFVTQMPDGKRLQFIQEAGNGMDQILGDLREFNQQNKMISLQRGVERGEVERVKKLYGF